VGTVGRSKIARESGTIGPLVIGNGGRYLQDSPTSATIGPPVIGNGGRYLQDSKVASESGKTGR
jgi:hypothetical protein